MGTKESQAAERKQSQYGPTVGLWGLQMSAQETEQGALWPSPHGLESQRLRTKPCMTPTCGEPPGAASAKAGQSGGGLCHKETGLQERATRRQDAMMSGDCGGDWHRL